MMKPERLAHIRSRLHLREDARARAQIVELCDAIDRLTADRAPGPTAEWLEDLRRQAQERMPDGG